MTDELRAALSAAEINDLPDSVFAYIESGGTKDDDGKTTPRSLRHYPVHDKAHADNALSRADAAVAGDDETAKGIAEKALPAIKAAVKKFGDAEEKKSQEWAAQHRGGMSYGDMQDLLCSAISAKFRPADLADDDYWYAYVVDFDDDTVVFSAKGEKMRCSYSLDGRKVTLGDAEPVRAQTTWVPVELNSADPSAAHRKRGVTVQHGPDGTMTVWMDDDEDHGDGDATPSRSKNFATAKRHLFAGLVEQAPARPAQVQIRMDQDDDADSLTAEFRGYAYTIDERYGVKDWLGEYDERIGPGASSKTLREQPSIPLLRNHDPNYVFANTSSGTSQLSDDGRGLLNGASLDRRQTYTNDTCISLARGDVGKMSFSFRAIAEDWNATYDDRLVKELQLFDTSIVTYPANPATTAELVDGMRSALGREGRSLWLADSELSVRSAFGPFTGERHSLPAGDVDDLLERALRALAHADEMLLRAHGPHGRARTFQVAGSLLTLRAGKVLSSANHKLLTDALTALSAADKAHETAGKAHATATEAVQNALNSATSKNDGTANGTPPGNGDPINPADGAGPRSASLKLQRQREAELRKLRRD